MDTKAKLRDFISQDLLSGHDSLQDDENLLTMGMVDSLGMMRLVLYLETDFDLAVPPEHFTIDNFGTINQIEQYINSHQNTHQ